MSMDDMTIGEIRRLLERLQESQDKQTNKLEEIQRQTTATNGNLIRHEGWLKRHDLEIRDLKHGERRNPQELKRASDSAEVITMTIPVGAISPKKIAGVIIAVAFGLFSAWKAGLFS